MHAHPSASRRWLFGLVAAVLSACTTSGVSADAKTQALCSAPQQGKRYAVCGQLTTGGLASAGARELNGSLNSETQTTAAGRYQVQGGTFHASH